MGVDVAVGVELGLGVAVGTGVCDGVGVQVAGNCTRDVGVAVDVGIITGNVAGGKGLKLPCGFRKITKNNPPMQIAVISTRTERIFQTKAPWFFFVAFSSWSS